MKQLKIFITCKKWTDVAVKMVGSGRQYVAEHYNRNVLAKSFEQLMSDLMDPGLRRDDG